MATPLHNKGEDRTLCSKENLEEVKWETRTKTKLCLMFHIQFQFHISSTYHSFLMSEEGGLLGVAQVL